MKILYHMPYLHTLNAGRTIYHGYNHAFTTAGHIFKPLTVNDDQEKLFNEYKPDLFITSLNHFLLKYTNLDLIKKQKQKGMKVFVLIPLWKSPLSRIRLNETPSISSNTEFVKLIQSGEFGDIYFNPIEQGDSRMEGFKKAVGYQHHTIPLAADFSLHYPDFSVKYKSDISFLGTFLPEKRKFIKEQVLPLRKNYNVKLYGQEWNTVNRSISFIQKVGQYFNIPILKSVLKPKLKLEDERKIYTSSTISINIHEEYQKKFGGDCNERTFKIPACGGFEITDDVECIRKYFREDTEIVIAKDKNDWFDKIKYYMENPEKRTPIIERGRQRVLKDHTYDNRVHQITNLYKELL